MFVIIKEFSTSYMKKNNKNPNFLNSNTDTTKCLFENRSFFVSLTFFFSSPDEVKHLMARVRNFIENNKHIQRQVFTKKRKKEIHWVSNTVACKRDSQ